MSVHPSGKNAHLIPRAKPVTVPQVTAMGTSKTSAFIDACKEQGVEPTKRQAARYNAGRGRWQV